MNIIDLTQLISSTMPVYPGTEQPVIVDATTIEKDGFAEKCLTFYSHTGTHIDAPGHILQGRHTLDQFSVDKYIGKGTVINLVAHGSNIIEKQSLETYSEDIAHSDFVLFYTGWDRKWGKSEYFSNFPVLSKEAVEWLCSYQIKGLGFDCISVDPVGDANMENHKIILNKEMVIIENLCNLDQLIGFSFTFSCLPLKIGNSDGSPIRAVGMIA